MAVAVGFVDVTADVAPGCAPPDVGSVVWRATGASGETLLSVSRETSNATEGGQEEATTWLCPRGTLLASLALADASLAGRVTAVAGSRVLVRGRVLWRAMGARSGGAAMAAAALVMHLRCDWAAPDASPELLHADPPACGVPGCTLGCAATGTDCAAASSLASLLAGDDLRPPPVDTSSVLVPKLDEARRRTRARVLQRKAL